MEKGLGAERARLVEAREQGVPWRRWGPYLSDRQWGTVREDYSAHGTAWESFPHEHAHARAYRWGEDGLLGISDDEGRLCFALALWNEADPILKERLFGLTGNQGNHGEDVKEYYFHLDSTPTHSYMKALYKYPQRAFPYEDLIDKNHRRGKDQPEYELIDTGVFAENRYFDVFVEYTKQDPEDIFVRITVVNRGPDPAPIHLVPNLWYRNTWAWGYDDTRPEIRAVHEATRTEPQAPAERSADGVSRMLHAICPDVGDYWLAFEGEPELLFTNNDTNSARLWGIPNRSRYVKDGFHDAIVRGDRNAVDPTGVGTKAAAHYRRVLAPGEAWTVRLRLSPDRHEAPFALCDQLFAIRQAEADEFYEQFAPDEMSGDARLVQRQAFAGLLWSKQWYDFNVHDWLTGDPAGPTPPEERWHGRNCEWLHMNCRDVLSMPDKWEYPWFAAWDLAFHCVPLAMVDPDFAKQQLILLGREWYLHPNAQIPAYEWAFGDVNPPVHAWATWRVYKIEQRLYGKGDRTFLERMFHKLMLNFVWWVNRKDAEGRNVFQGGFLGLDNIGVFDRSAALPTGGHIDQSDGTAWMGMYCLNLLTIALELARENRAYEDIASKFFEHFLSIAQAMSNRGGEIDLWDEEDEFFYDVLHLPDESHQALKVRSLVGLIPLLAVETIEPELLDMLPDFKGRLEWFLEHRPQLSALVSRWYEPGTGDRRLLALVRGHRMKRLLFRMLDPNEFLSDYGIRSVSKIHEQHPYVFDCAGSRYQVDYEPGESTSSLFGGNSNWRGPIWFPINFLLIETLQKFHHYYGDDFLVEYPTGSGEKLTLWQIADALSCRLTHIFKRDADDRRPVLGDHELFQTDPHWRDYVPFYEYFHGDNGRGVGASHQTGWTAVVAKLLEQTRGRDVPELSSQPITDAPEDSTLQRAVEVRDSVGEGAG